MRKTTDKQKPLGKARRTMTLEEIGADVILGCVAMQLAGLQSRAAATPYIERRREESPFAAMLCQGEQFNPDEVLHAMGLDDEQILAYQNAVIATLPSVF